MAAIRNYDANTVGSQEVLAAVKKKRKPGMILFSAFAGIALLLMVIGFIVENYVLFVVAGFFFLVFLPFAIVFLVKYTHPMKCRELKKNPVALQQADWMFRNIIFQNDMVVVSQSFFAPKSDIAAIFPVQEVLLMYKRIVTTNFSTMYFWVIETVRGTSQIAYPKSMEEVMTQCIDVIAPLCPHIRIGHNQENLNYRDYMRAMWEQTQVNQGTNK